MRSAFTRKLLIWHETIDRPLPWKGETNPYFVWLSEIILQQTRAEQGVPYFLKFKNYFPTVKSLALASEDEVLRLWQGLGYYSRARNLHTAANYIHKELGGKFPRDYEGIRKIKGVGDYTAAAVASFAYNLPYAVVDGNVCRVLSRVFGIKAPIDSAAGKKEIRLLAEKLLPEAKAAKFNQAIMDFGAVQCVPKNPDCINCPMKTECYAFKNEEVSFLPVKSKKVKVKNRYFHYLVIKQGTFTYLSKRNKKDIWMNMYEFPMIESNYALSKDELKAAKSWKKLFKDKKVKDIKLAASLKQTLTHQKIQASFFTMEIGNKLDGENIFQIKKSSIGNYAFPGVIRSFLEANFADQFVSSDLKSAAAF